MSRDLRFVTEFEYQGQRAFTPEDGTRYDVLRTEVLRVGSTVYTIHHLAPQRPSASVLSLPAPPSPPPLGAELEPEHWTDEWDVGVQQDMVRSGG